MQKQDIIIDIERLNRLFDNHQQDLTLLQAVVLSVLPSLS